ncbi:MAG: hypothetical protein H0W58_05720, partial [Acidobacteria bacterium]|nr:hypothetical protein [Acidobacteriota bacterium]
MWFATKKGLVKYADGAAEIFTIADGLPSNDVRIVHEARDGSLWIGCFGGIAQLKSEEGSALAGGSADLEMRISDFGLTSAQTTNPQSQIPNPQSNRPLTQAVLTERDGLAGNFVRAIYEDTGGAFWIGTYDSGLSRFKDGKFTNYTTADGLFSNGVFQILEDERDNFWMSSNQGIYRVGKQQLNDFADGKISAITSVAYGKSDGMLNIECNGGRQPAGIKTADGKFWFPTQDGAAIINPEAVPFNP